MGLECGGGELEIYELQGMDVGVPTSIPCSFKYVSWKTTLHDDERKMDIAALLWQFDIVSETSKLD